MRFNRSRLLNFYDNENWDPEANFGDGGGGHSSALNGLLGEDLVLALFAHYWDQTHEHRPNIVSYRCTTGRRQGPRLDAWINPAPNRELDQGDFLFQTEIKNWSRWGVGGSYNISPDAGTDEVLKEAHRQWDIVASPNHERNVKALSKVMSNEMQLPENHGHFDARPLLLMWRPILPPSQKHLTPFVRVGETGHYLCGAWLFSASIFLRTGNLDEALDLEMPRAGARLRLLEYLQEA